MNVIRLIFYFGILFFCVACRNSMSLNEVFNKTLQMERFEIVERPVGGFPESFGTVTTCAHPNSSLREDIIELLSNLPEEWLAFEISDERLIYRIYISPNDSVDNVLVVLVGQGGGDTMMSLFSATDMQGVKQFVSQLNEEYKQ